MVEAARAADTSGPPRSASSRPGSACARRSSGGRTSSSTPTPSSASCGSPGSARQDSRRRGRPGPGLAHPGAAARRRATSTAVEVDPALAAALPEHRAAPGARRTPTGSPSCTPTRCGCASCPGPPPTALVANLPYNVSVPVVLRFLEAFPTLERVLVMVQLEVAERLAAEPGLQGLRRAQRQGGVVRRRAPGGHGVAQRVLAGAQRRLGSGGPDPAAGHRRPPHPRGGLRVRRRSLRPAPQDAARGARRLGRVRRRGPRRSCAPPASTPAPAASSSASRPSPRSRPRGCPRVCA